MILIVSHRDDLHALAVQARLSRDFGAECHIVECDDFVDSAGFAWSRSGASSGDGCVPVRGGGRVDPAEASVVWWRRISLPQLGAGEPYSYENAFATAEWRHALLGMLLDRFQGQWVSDPQATRTAANKLHQLGLAVAGGWVIPSTIVTSDADRIREFCESAPDQRVILKAMGATRGRSMATVSKTWPELDEADLTLCPGIYQHLVPGRRHLRINCYGDVVVAFAIETDIMDWRRDHSAATTHVELDAETEQRCRALIARLGLRMGVIDAKVLDDGSPCFLEVNPQGQFLFLEAATGVDLSGACAAFLHQQVGIREQPHSS